MNKKDKNRCQVPNQYKSIKAVVKNASDYHLFFVAITFGSLKTGIREI